MVRLSALSPALALLLATLSGAAGQTLNKETLYTSPLGTEEPDTTPLADRFFDPQPLAGRSLRNESRSGSIGPPGPPLLFSQPDRDVRPLITAIPLPAGTGGSALVLRGDGGTTVTMPAGGSLTVYDGRGW